MGGTLEGTASTSSKKYSFHLHRSSSLLMKMDLCKSRGKSPMIKGQGTLPRVLL